MNLSDLSTDQVSTLIARMLGEKDLASVGLRRILRRKTVEAQDFPMHTPTIEEFTIPGKGKKLLSDDERRIVELERQVKDAKDTVERQVESARKAVANAYAQGYEKGHEKGLEEGKSQAEGEYRKQIGAAQDRIGLYLKKLEEEKRSIFANADRILLELCCKLVKKIIATEPLLQQDVVLCVLKKSLSYIAEREKLVIRVAPDDIETVTNRKDFWAPVTDRLHDIVIEPDKRVEKGGCIIESNSGVVDARLGVQMDELTEIVEKAWESAQSAHAEKENSSEARDT